MKPARAVARATARGIVIGVARSAVIARWSLGNLEIASVASLPRNDADLKLLQLSLHPRVVRGWDSFRSRSVSCTD